MSQNFSAEFVQEIGKIAKREKCSLKTPTGRGKLFFILTTQKKYKKIGNLTENDIKKIADEINHKH